MNILVITQLYPQPDDTGHNKPTKTVEYFAKEWVTLGHSVIVVHCPSKFPLVFYYAPRWLKNKLGGASSNIIPPIESRKMLYREAYGIKVLRKPMFKFLPGMGYSEKTINKVSHEIIEYVNSKQFIPDLVVGHFANPSTALVSTISNIMHLPSSIVFHHDCTERNISKYHLDKYIKNIGAIGARSILEAQEVKERLGLERLPFLCYSGVPNDAVRAAETVCSKMDFSAGVRYIYVGSFIKRKHLDSVIKAFIKTKKKGDILEIVGGGPEEHNIKKLVQEVDKDHSIHFIGRIPRDKVLDHMKKGQIFTLISDNETYGMVYAEAMLQGCLVIASKCGGFDGIIVDGENGFLCNPGDEDMLSMIYRKISNLSIEERNRIGQAAINTALHLSEKEVAMNYLNDILRTNGKDEIE